MRNISAYNVNWAFMDGFHWLRAVGVHEQSRNGPVLVCPEPVCTTYLRPTERVLFNPTRDANPVFHLMEAIWMLAGRNNVDWLLPFNARFSEYAEDNGTIHGAYGFRWRQHFGVDQVAEAIGELQADKNSRRVVIGMWDVQNDMGRNYKDIPCNTTIYLDCRGGRLNMTVCCRSNDILWGAYGANVVHFSMLQELIAYGVDIPVGSYRQMSNNFHLYTDLLQARALLETPPMDPFDYYEAGKCEVMPMMTGDETWQDFLDDCEKLTGLKGLNDRERHATEYATKFFNELAYPLWATYLHRKAGHPIHERLSRLPGNVDWTVAFKEWLLRREAGNASE